MIPTDFKYNNLKERLTGGKLLKRDFTPEAGTGGGSAISGYKPGETIKIRLYGRDLFMDTERSYLQFSVNETNTQEGANAQNVEMFLDGSAYNFIDYIKIYDETTGVLLDEFYQYGKTVNKLLTAKLSSNQITAPFSFSGFNDNEFGYSIPATGTAKTRFVRLPLYGLGLFNLTQDNSFPFPLGLLKNGIRLEIKLINTPNDIYKFNTTTAITNNSNFRINNIKYTANCTQLTGEMMEAIKTDLKQENNGSIIPFSSYTYKVNRIQNTSSSLYYSLNLGAKSLKSVYVIPFQTQYYSNTGAVDQSAYRISYKSSSDYNNFRNFRAIVNNYSFPQNPLNGIELFSELENALGNNKIGNINYNNYYNTNRSIVFGTGTYNPIKNDFIAGIDFEALHSQEFMSGVNMSESQLPILLQADIDPTVYDDDDNTHTKNDFVIAALVDTVVNLNLDMGTIEVKY